VFFGENGALAINGSGYTVFDPAGKELRSEKGDGGDVTHTDNLVAAIRAGAPLNSGIDEAHVSTLICHLGNISQRVGRSLRCNPADGHILDDDEAMRHWKRAYEPGWEPSV
jgi:hypothetical protein